MTNPNDATGQALLFFSARPDAFPLYQVFFEKLLARHPDAGVKVQKTQITFSNRYGFAFVSLPLGRVKNAPECAIIISFGLGSRLLSPRVFQATEPYPNRWTHHVIVTEWEQLDDELMGWIDAAYGFAAGKGKAKG